MQKTHLSTITRLERMLAELECEFHYLINDIYVDDHGEAGAPRPVVARIELAQRCLSTAAEALRDEPLRDGHLKI